MTIINTLSIIIDISKRRNYYLYINEYIIKYDHYYQLYYLIDHIIDNKQELIKFLFNKQELIKFLFKKNVNLIKINKKNFYLNIIAIIIIQRGYRMYRIKTARIRNDLVIRGLSELWFHPSRLTFEC